MALRLSGLQMGTIHCSYALMQAGQAQRPGKISGVYEYLTDDAPGEHFLWANGISYCSAPKTACRNDNTLQVQHPLTFCDSSRYASKEIPLDYFLIIFFAFEQLVRLSRSKHYIMPCQFFFNCPVLKAVLDIEIIYDNSAAHISFAEDLPERLLAQSEI